MSLPETVVLCKQGADWDVWRTSGGPKKDFGVCTEEAFVLSTEAAFAALVVWEACSEAAWAAWKSCSEAA